MPVGQTRIISGRGEYQPLENEKGADNWLLNFQVTKRPRGIYYNTNTNTYRSFFGWATVWYGEFIYQQVELVYETQGIISWNNASKTISRNIGCAHEAIKQYGWDNTDYLSKQLRTVLQTIVDVGSIVGASSDSLAQFGANQQDYDLVRANYEPLDIKFLSNPITSVRFVLYKDTEASVQGIYENIEPCGLAIPEAQEIPPPSAPAPPPPPPGQAAPPAQPSEPYPDDTAPVPNTYTYNPNQDGGSTGVPPQQEAEAPPPPPPDTSDCTGELTAIAITTEIFSSNGAPYVSDKRTVIAYLRLPLSNVSAALFNAYSVSVNRDVPAVIKLVVQRPEDAEPVQAGTYNCLESGGVEIKSWAVIFEPGTPPPSDDKCLISPIYSESQDD